VGRALATFAPGGEVDTTAGYALSSADVTLIRYFLIRPCTMHPHARADLARLLAAVLSERYTLPFDGANPEEFLRRLTP
jgi:hypothetical protein